MTNANWMTAEAISERYLVGEARLLRYAARGNLPFRRLEGGAALFDESVCARFFRPRTATVFSYPEPKGPHLGILGLARMGGEAAATRSSRERSGRFPIEAETSVRETAPRRRTAG